jgi:hypothetical protein
VAYVVVSAVIEEGVGHLAKLESTAFERASAATGGTAGCDGAPKKLLCGEITEWRLLERYENWADVRLEDAVDFLEVGDDVYGDWLRTIKMADDDYRR